jgi:hypothetical protein
LRLPVFRKGPFLKQRAVDAIKMIVEIFGDLPRLLNCRSGLIREKENVLFVFPPLLTYQQLSLVNFTVS